MTLSKPEPEFFGTGGWVDNIYSVKTPLNGSHIYRAILIICCPFALSSAYPKCSYDGGVGNEWALSFSSP